MYDELRECIVYVIQTLLFMSHNPHPIEGVKASHQDAILYITVHMSIQFCG